MVLFFKGGADSFSMLVPHSECTWNNNKDMFKEYTEVRTVVALPKTELLPIDSHEKGKQVRAEVETTALNQCALLP